MMMITTKMTMMMMMIAAVITTIMMIIIIVFPTLVAIQLNSTFILGKPRRREKGDFFLLLPLPLPLNHWFSSN